MWHSRYYSYSTQTKPPPSSFHSHVRVISSGTCQSNFCIIIVMIMFVFLLLLLLLVMVLVCVGAYQRALIFISIFVRMVFYTEHVNGWIEDLCNAWEGRPMSPFFPYEKRTYPNWAAARRQERRCALSAIFVHAMKSMCRGPNVTTLTPFASYQWRRGWLWCVCLGNFSNVSFIVIIIIIIGINCRRMHICFSLPRENCFMCLFVADNGKSD